MHKLIISILLFVPILALPMNNSKPDNDTIKTGYKFDDSTYIRYVFIRHKISEILVYKNHGDSLIQLGYQYYFKKGKLKKIYLIDTSILFSKFNIQLDEKNCITKVEYYYSDTCFGYIVSKVKEWAKSLDCTYDATTMIPTFLNNQLWFNYNCHGELTQIFEQESRISGPIKSGIELYHINLRVRGTQINFNGKPYGPYLVLNKKGKLIFFIFNHPNTTLITKFNLRQLRNLKRE